MTGWAVIVNLKSGKRHFQGQMNYLHSQLAEHSVEHEMRITEFAGHATLIARNFLEQGYRRFLIVGGDGTVNEVINGLFNNPNVPDDLEFGLIPRGTGNDWARYWGLNSNYKHSIDVFLNGKSHPIDLGKVSYNIENNTSSQYFINSVGFGLDAEVAHQANHLKKYLGSHSFLYLIALLKLVFTFKTRTLKIERDGKISNTPLFTMNVANGCYSGGGMKQNPDAKPDDGLFDVMMVRKPSFREIITALTMIFNGKLLQHPAIESYRTTRIKMDCEHGSSLFETDGIVVHCTPPIEVSVLPKAIRMIIPK